MHKKIIHTQGATMYVDLVNHRHLTVPLYGINSCLITWWNIQKH